jgi:glycosyltransferase involved in cell wall biosynthesis
VETVAAAVESVLAQTFGGFELVVVDDGSTDGTGELLRTLARRDARIRVLQGRGAGLVAALNQGLDACRGAYVARMDADDVALPERLERSLQALDADEKLAGVGTQVEVFRDDQPVSPSMSRYVAWLNSLTDPALLFRERFIESPLCHPTVMFRRPLVQAAGGYEDGAFPEDYELWLRLLSLGHRLVNLPQVLYRWRDGEARLTRTDARYDRERFSELKGAFLARDLPPGRLWICGAGPLGKGIGRALMAAGRTVAGFIDLDPRKLGQRPYGVEVLPVSALPPPTEREHVIASVGLHGVRELLRETLRARGFVEGESFTCAA